LNRLNASFEVGSKLFISFKVVLVSKKKKSKKEIRQDSDGTYFCADCGKAGFKGYMNGLAHLRHCKGFEAISEEINQEHRELNDSLLSMIGKNQSPTNNQADVGTHTPPPASAYFKETPARTHAEPRRLRSQTATAEPHAEPRRKSSYEKVLEAKIEKMVKHSEKLHKYAFNHVQHAVPRNKISSPNDLLMSGLNDLAQNVWFQRIIAFGALIWAISWIKENLEKLDRKSSNSGKKSKND
jgi:hypothetical protein